MLVQMNYKSPVGNLVLSASEKGIVSLSQGFAKRESSNKHLIQATQQLNEYFNGERQSFRLKFDWQGTAFQKRCWSALLDIDYGATCSYKDQAIKISGENYTRAVASANNRNPLPIFVPCHRVIGSDGSLVGYAWGLKTKKYLLDLEKRCREDSRHL